MDEKEWGEWSFDCKDADGQFLDGPGLIKKLIVSPKNNKKTDAAFYDGHTTGGKLKITLRCATNQTCSVDFEIPFKVEQGFM